MLLYLYKENEMKNHLKKRNNLWNELENIKVKFVIN